MGRVAPLILSLFALGLFSVLGIWLFFWLQDRALAAYLRAKRVREYLAADTAERAEEKRREDYRLR